MYKSCFEKYNLFLEVLSFISGAEIGKIAVFVVSKDGQPQALQTLPNGIDSTDPDLPDLTTPVYILVDSNTASAAEVFAAAMRVNETSSIDKIIILKFA